MNKILEQNGPDLWFRILTIKIIFVIKNFVINGMLYHGNS